MRRACAPPRAHRAEPPLAQQPVGAVGVLQNLDLLGADLPPQLAAPVYRGELLARGAPPPLAPSADQQHGQHCRGHRRDHHHSDCGDGSRPQPAAVAAAPAAAAGRRRGAGRGGRGRPSRRRWALCEVCVEQEGEPRGSSDHPRGRHGKQGTVHLRRGSRGMQLQVLCRHALHEMVPCAGSYMIVVVHSMSCTTEHHAEARKKPQSSAATLHPASAQHTNFCYPWGTHRDYCRRPRGPAEQAEQGGQSVHGGTRPNSTGRLPAQHCTAHRAAPWCSCPQLRHAPPLPPSPTGSALGCMSHCCCPGRLRSARCPGRRSERRCPHSWRCGCSGP